jgi:hypothetical protein
MAIGITGELASKETKRRIAISSVDRSRIYYLFIVCSLALLLSTETWADPPTPSPSSTPSSERFVEMLSQTKQLERQEAKDREDVFFFNRAITVLTDLKAYQVEIDSPQNAKYVKKAYEDAKNSLIRESRVLAYENINEDLTTLERINFYLQQQTDFRNKMEDQLPSIDEKQAQLAADIDAYLTTESPTDKFKRTNQFIFHVARRNRYSRILYHLIQIPSCRPTNLFG